jgi:hypothetical protein
MVRRAVILEVRTVTKKSAAKFTSPQGIVVEISHLNSPPIRELERYRLIVTQPERS